LAVSGLLGDRCLEVRYENLVRDPHTVLRAICKHAGYRFSSQYAALVPLALPDMDRKWRNAFTVEQHQRMKDAIGDLLERLGYEL